MLHMLQLEQAFCLEMQTVKLLSVLPECHPQSWILSTQSAQLYATLLHDISEEYLLNKTCFQVF